MHIQAKTGYYAWAVPPGEGSERAVAGTQFDAAEIGLSGSLTVDPKDKRSMQLTCASTPTTSLSASKGTIPTHN